MASKERKTPFKPKSMKKESAVNNLLVAKDLLKLLRKIKGIITLVIISISIPRLSYPILKVSPKGKTFSGLKM